MKDIKRDFMIRRSISERKLDKRAKKEERREKARYIQNKKLLFTYFQSVPY